LSQASNDGINFRRRIPLVDFRKNNMRNEKIKWTFNGLQNYPKSLVLFKRSQCL